MVMRKYKELKIKIIFATMDDVITASRGGVDYDNDTLDWGM